MSMLLYWIDFVDIEVRQILEECNGWLWYSMVQRVFISPHMGWWWEFIERVHFKELYNNEAFSPSCLYMDVWCTNSMNYIIFSVYHTSKSKAKNITWRHCPDNGNQPLIRLRVRDEYNTHASMQGARMQGCWLQVTRLQQCRVKGCRLQGARCGVQDAGHKGAGCRS